MPEDSETSEEKEMAQDWRRGQRSEGWAVEDGRRQNVPCGASAEAGSEREASPAGTQSRTRDRRTRRPEVQMYVPRPMRDRLKKQDNPNTPPTSATAEQPDKGGTSSGVASKNLRQHKKGTVEESSQNVRGAKSHKSHRESTPTGSKKHRSTKEHRHGGDGWKDRSKSKDEQRGRGKKEEVQRQKGTKDTSQVTSDKSDAQVKGKVKESIKMEAEESLRSTHEDPTQSSSTAVAIDWDQTETGINSEDLACPDEQVPELKATPEKVAKVSNVQDDVHSIVCPIMVAEVEEATTGAASKTGESESTTGISEASSFTSKDIITSSDVVSRKTIESSSQFSSSSVVHSKDSSALVDVEISDADHSDKTGLHQEVEKDERRTQTNNREISEYLSDEIRVTEEPSNDFETGLPKREDEVLTVTRGMKEEIEEDKNVPVTSTIPAQLAGDKATNTEDVSVDTKLAASSSEVVDMTVCSASFEPEEAATTFSDRESTVPTDKGNSRQTTGIEEKDVRSQAQVVASENKCDLKNSEDGNEDDDDSEEFWDAEMELKGCGHAAEDDVITGQLEATCDDGQVGEAVAMETDEDSWDAMFDDNGECLNPDQMEELLAGVKKVKVTTQKPKHDYWNWKPKDIQLEEGYGHIVELCDFPAEFKTPDLVAALAEFQSQGFNIKWVDDTHALAVFSTQAVAMRALQIQNPLMRVRPMSEATQQSKKKARNCSEFLQPFKPRPEASAMVARRLVSGALGVRANIPREKRDEERRKLKEAKERKKLATEQRESAWEGR